jgi:hypothetical protein
VCVCLHARTSNFWKASSGHLIDLKALQWRCSSHRLLSGERASNGMLFSPKSKYVKFGKKERSSRKTPVSETSFKTASVASFGSSTRDASNCTHPQTHTNTQRHDSTRQHAHDNRLFNRKYYHLHLDSYKHESVQKWFDSFPSFRYPTPH